MRIFFVFLLILAATAQADYLAATSIYTCNCRLVEVSNCNGGCALARVSSYLNTATPEYPQNMWNGVSFEIKDLTEIGEFLAAQKLSSVTWRGYTFELASLISDLTERVQTSVNILTTYHLDEVRGQNRMGLCMPLNANSGPISGKVFCYHFHDASLIESILLASRFLKKQGLDSALYEDWLESTDLILSQYFSEWNRDVGLYHDPAEEAYVGGGQQVYTAYNMTATIAAAYLLMSDATGKNIYWRRAKAMAEALKGTNGVINPNDNLWYYSLRRDRTEDPDHALEVLRFVGLAVDRNLLPKRFKRELWRRWWQYGVTGDFLRQRIEVDSPATTITISELANRFPF